MIRRVCVTVGGVVQGVGFRPFVYREATMRDLCGWVRNDRDGVAIEVQGDSRNVSAFLSAIRAASPPAEVRRWREREIALQQDGSFRIAASRGEGEVYPLLPADLAPCTECIAEIEDRNAQRHGYPFTTCARCGPRYTIIEALPFDRSRTSMRGFPMCRFCADQYADSQDRRLHAQTVACAACGPRLVLLDARGRVLSEGDDALRAAIACALGGSILAIQAAGGFQLAVDATSEQAVSRLRKRKQRPDKPFAVMFASLVAVRRHAQVSPDEAAVLASPAAPIVLVRRRIPLPGGEPPLAPGVAPRTPRLGVMLPSSPLHHLFMKGVERPLVCTSGNLSDEPLCVSPAEVVERLAGVVDGILAHDRPIVRPVDDSVVRVGPKGMELQRRARGFAPLPLGLAEAWPAILALGGHLKGTIALCRREELIVSQHLGDLDTALGSALLEKTARDFITFFDTTPELVACDLHPDYASTRLAERFAEEYRIPIERVQHHHAHVAAVMVEHGFFGPVLGLAWDGAGLGPDGTLWGGEALLCERRQVQRVAHLRPFRLPGGAAAMREPRRSALGLLHALCGDNLHPASRLLFTDAERTTLGAMLSRGVASPWTTSIGRLFDAIACLAGVCDRCTYEGQAAIALEALCEDVQVDAPYALPLAGGDPLVIDWGPLVHAVLADRDHGVPAALIAARFHEAMAQLAASIACRIGTRAVALSGGCFQNHLLSARARALLEQDGAVVLTPQRYPPNDGGLALGQAYIAAERWKERQHVSGNSR